MQPCSAEVPPALRSVVCKTELWLRLRAFCRPTACKQLQRVTRCSAELVSAAREFPRRELLQRLVHTAESHLRRRGLALSCCGFCSWRGVLSFFYVVKTEACCVQLSVKCSLRATSRVPRSCFCTTRTVGTIGVELHLVLLALLVCTREPGCTLLLYVLLVRSQTADSSWCACTRCAQRSLLTRVSKLFMSDRWQP